MIMIPKVITEKKQIGYSPKVKEYKNESKRFNLTRDRIEYFDPKDIDPLVKEDFFSLACKNWEIRTNPNGDKYASMAGIYQLINKIDYTNEQVMINNKHRISKLDIQKLYKRLYMFMVRYVNFNKFCSVISNLYPYLSMVPNELLSKITTEINDTNINVNSILNKNTKQFPTQKQTLEFIDKQIRNASKTLSNSNHDMLLFLMRKRIPGFSTTAEERLLELRLNDFFGFETSEYYRNKVDSEATRWVDVDYFSIIFTMYIHEKQRFFEPGPFIQLESYLEDLLQNMTLLDAPIKIIEYILQNESHQVHKSLSYVLAPKFNITVFVSTTNVISLDPKFFCNSNIMSGTQFKNLLFLFLLPKQGIINLIILLHLYLMSVFENIIPRIYKLILNNYI